MIVSQSGSARIMRVAVVSASLKLFGVEDEPFSPTDVWIHRIIFPWVPNVTNWNTQSTTTETNAATIPATSRDLKWG